MPSNKKLYQRTTAIVQDCKKCKVIEKSALLYPISYIQRILIKKHIYCFYISAFDSLYEYKQFNLSWASYI